MLELDDIFGAEGPLARALPDFMPRPQQLRMAERELGELRQRKDSNSGDYAAMLERLIASVEEASA